MPILLEQQLILFILRRFCFVFMFLCVLILFCLEALKGV